MKSYLPVWFAAALWLGAAEPSGERAADPEPGSSDLIVDAEHGEFGMKSGVITYWGNVRVDDPGKMHLTSEYLLVIRPSTNIESITAKTNVVIDLIDADGEKTKARGAQAVYTASNNIVELTGNPSMENSKSSMTADLITLDRANNNLYGTGKVKSRFKAGLLTTTNNPPKAATNSAPKDATKSPPKGATNRPPAVKAANGPA